MRRTVPLLLLLTAVAIAVPLLPFLFFGARLDQEVVKWLEPAPPVGVLAAIEVVVLAADVLLPVPSSVVATLGGSQLGMVLGTACAWLGLMAGSLCGWWIGWMAGSRAIARLDPTEREMLNRQRRRLGPLLIVLTRPLPLLAEATAMFSGAAGVALSDFCLASAGGNLAIAFVWSLIGSLGHKHDSLEWALIWSLVAPVALTWLILRVRRQSLRKTIGDPEVQNMPASHVNNSPASKPPIAGTVAESLEPAQRRGLLRQLYNWVLSWADSPHGLTALAVLSFAESSFFPIPPDVLQIALSVAKPRRSFLYAFVSALASVLGGIAGWAIGWGLWHVVDDWFFQFVPGFSHEKFSYVESLYKDNAFFAIFLAAFTPIPYKIFTIAAGVFAVPLSTLVVASALGRSGRFFLVASVMWVFGAHAKEFLERYLEVVTIALAALVIAGFLALRWLAV